jgi:hypothetical protein
MGKIIISGDGSGDFNCDGKADQVQINQAFNYQRENPEESLYLKGPFTYKLTDTILTSNSFIWEGDSAAVLTVDTSSLWPKHQQLIKQSKVKESDPNDKKISGFVIDGQADILNEKYAPNSELRGDGYYNLIELSHGTIELSEMTLRNSLNDGLIARYADVIFRNNKVTDLGHEALYAKKCSVQEYENKIKTMTNSGGRIQDCQGPVKIHDNEIWTIFGPDAGGPGLQIQFTKGDSCKYMKDVEIWNNKIHDTYGPGIWLVAYGGDQYSKEDVQGVHIHDNVFTGCGTHKNYDWLAGIVTSGFYETLIEDNIFINCYGAAVLIKNALGLKPNGVGEYSTIVQNNQINGTVKMKCGVGGQGIRNETPDIHTVTSNGNYIWDNEEGPYYKVRSSSDIFHEPLDEPEEPEIKVPTVLEFECSEEEISKLKGNINGIMRRF